MGIVRDSFVVFKNWIEAIEKLPNKYQLECYKALAYYGLNGEIQSDLSPVAQALITSFSVGMENNISRYRASVENGKKGGAPKGNQNAKKEDKVIHNLEEKQPRNNLEQPRTSKNNLNVNDNVNDIKLVNNIFKNYQSSCACERVPVRDDGERKPYISFYKDYFDWSYGAFRDVGFEIVDTMIEAKDQSDTEVGLVFKGKTYHLNDFVKMIAKIDCDSFRKIVSQIKFKEDIQNRPIYILGCLETAAESGDYKLTQKEFEQFVKNLEIKEEKNL